MLEQAFAIFRNTFFESIRQPILLVLLIPSALLILLSNPFSAYTMGDDQRMLVDIGMSTIFISGVITSSFIAASVLTREIENRTALTVISKPVGRPVFIVSKFLGVAGAQTVATLLLCFVFLLVELHGARQTARTPLHLPVILFGITAAVAAVGTGAWCNFFYSKSFASTTICTATPLLGVAYAVSMMFDRGFSPQNPATVFDPNMWLALICMMMALLILTAIAIAASTRLGQVMTLAVTLGIFLLGLMSDYLFGRPLARTTELLETVAAGGPEITIGAGQMVLYWFYKISYTVIPNIQVLWLADAVTQEHAIPLSYVVRSMAYGLLFIAVALSIAVILFQRREVG